MTGLVLRSEQAENLTHNQLTANFQYLENLGLNYGVRAAALAMTFYVSPTGSDANDGLLNTTPVKTIAKAIELLSKYHHRAYIPVIQLADGTYSETVDLPEIISNNTSVRAYLRGNLTTPANVVISSNNANGTINARGSQGWQVEGFKVTNSVGSGIHARHNASLNYGKMVFGTCAQAHVVATTGAFVAAVDNYSIDAGAAQHFYSQLTGIVSAQSRTITITNTPAFSSAFAESTFNGTVWSQGCTFVGGVTGKRYNATLNASIYTTAGATYFPGSVAGTLSTGAQYA